MSQPQATKSNSTRMIVVAVIIVVVVAGVVAYFYLPNLTSGGSTSPSSTPSSSTTTGVTGGMETVNMPLGVGVNQSLNFVPATVTIVIGVNNTVIWIDKDITPHTVVSSSVPAGAQSFSSPLMYQGDNYKVTLTVAGTYKYYCSVHPTYMIGTIVVKS